MMKVRGAGMETPVSMMVLMLTALLIGSVIASSSDETEEGDLPALRTVQAMSLSSALARFRTANGEDLPQLIGTVRLEVWRDVGGDLDYSRDPGPAEVPIRDILSKTPDGLEASILFSYDVNDVQHLEGSRSSSRTELAGGLFLTVILPHQRGSMHPWEGPS